MIGGLQAFLRFKAFSSLGNCLMGLPASGSLNVFPFVLQLDIPELGLHRKGCWRDRSNSLDLSLILHVVHTCFPHGYDFSLLM